MDSIGVALIAVTENRDKWRALFCHGKEYYAWSQASAAVEMKSFVLLGCYAA
jgi:hypothetical protein